MNKTNDINKLFARILNTKRKAMSVKNKTLTASTGEIIDFTELSDEDTPAVGDIATIDGETAEGEILYQDSDGKLWIYKFEGGELKEIVEKEDESEEMTTEELIEANKALTEQLSALQAKYDGVLEKANDWQNLYNEVEQMQRALTSNGSAGISAKTNRLETKKDTPRNMSSEAEKAKALRAKRANKLV